MNHQELLWNVHSVMTLVLTKQLNFLSAVVRAKRSSCLLSGCDGVELNVLKDILGEPANDEFAAELDTQAKTSGKMTVFGYLFLHHSTGYKDCSSYMTCIKCMQYGSFTCDFCM